MSGNGQANQTIAMTKVAGTEHYYQAAIPNGYTHIMFNRCDSSGHTAAVVCRPCTILIILCRRIAIFSVCRAIWLMLLPNGWGNAYIHLSSADENLPDIDVAMSKEKDGIFYYDVPAGYDGVVFRPIKMDGTDKRQEV